MAELLEEIISYALVTFTIGCAVMICYRFFIAKIQGNVQISNTMVKDLKESYEFLNKRN